MGTAILLTGRPGCGKTTLIRRVVARLPGPVGGFYTQEIRHQGVRLGFEIVTLDGQRAVLAHVNIHGPQRISRYGVSIEALDTLAVGAIRQALAGHSTVVIDEIGPMEILSQLFRQAVLDALNSAAVVLGTIARRKDPFLDRIKALPHVTLIEVRHDNREVLPETILSLLHKR